jgi:hypothetical protein
VLWGLYQSG